MKEEKSEVIDRGSTAGGPHLTGGELKRAERLRRYARLRFCFVADLGDGIGSRVPEDERFQSEDVIT